MIRNDEIHWEYIVHQVGFIYKITVGHLYQSFSGLNTKLWSKDALTHNVDTVWLVEDCNCMKLYINIHSSLMYNGVTIICSSPDIQSVNYSCLKYRDLLFMIFTLQNSITALWLEQWLLLALSHIQSRKTLQWPVICALF